MTAAVVWVWGISRVRLPTRKPRGQRPCPRLDGGCPPKSPQYHFLPSILPQQANLPRFRSVRDACAFSTIQAPLPTSPHLCHICASYFTQLSYAALYATNVEETRTPLCQCNSRFGNVHVAKILLCRSQLHPNKVRSNVSQVLARRATLQICSISDACLLTASCQRQRVLLLSMSLGSSTLLM